MQNLVVLSTLCSYVAVCLGFNNTIRQCTCAEIEPCKNDYIKSFIPCADKCKDHAVTLSADYSGLRSCILSYEDNIKETIQCTQETIPEACAQGPPGLVEKRYPETLKIAVLSEIKSLLSHAGVAGQVKSLVVVGKKFFECLRSCVDETTGHCVQRAKCGLKLPSDAALVENAKNCAIQHGFDNKAIQDLCRCGVTAGLVQLESVCTRLKVD